MTEKSINEDEELVQLAKKDISNFSVLYDKYYPTVYKFIHKRLDNLSLSGDLCSKVFIKAMENVYNYKFQGVLFSSWLYKIARNELTDYYRKQKKERTVQLKVSDVEHLLSLVELEQQNDPYRTILLFFETLTDTESELIELRFFENMSFEELSAFYEIKQSAIKMRVYRILEKGKKYINQNMQEL